MKNIGEKKYTTLYPDSMINNTKILYHQTNRKLNSFLLNNFSSNSLIKYKFPIKKPNSSLMKKPSIKRKSTIVKRRPNSSEKITIRTIIESLRHDNCKSYNYYDNTKGPLKVKQNNNRNKKITKQKSYNNLHSNSNDSNINNLNLLSFDSKTRSPKSNNNYNSNLSLFKINKKKYINRKNFENKNSNLNSFSFSNYIISKKNNSISKNISRPDTPSSTRYKSNLKRNSLKLEYDSLSFNNSIKKNNSKNPSTFPANRNKKYSKSNETIENCLSNRKLNLSEIRLGKDQRRFHQQLYLNNLRSQIRMFEVSNGLQVNEEQIRTNLISQNKFQRDKFVQEIKRASNHNDFFFKKFPFQMEKFENLQTKEKKRSQSPHQNLCDDKSKQLLKNIDNLYKKLNVSQNYIKNLNNRLRTNNLKRIIDFVIPVEQKTRKIDEQFKDETVNYQRNIGKFFIFRGSGVYSGHLSSILKGDKIIRQTIKFENI